MEKEPRYGSKAWFLMTPDEIEKFRKEHDEIPVRPRGRPMRKVKIGECLEIKVGGKREEGRGCGRITCSKCPKYQAKIGYCPILAQFRKPDVAACKYGKLLIAQEKRSSGVQAFRRLD